MFVTPAPTAAQRLFPVICSVCLLAYVLIDAAVLKAQEAPQADNPIVLREALAVPVLQRQGFGGVHTDPVEAQRVAGTWKQPKVGDTIEDAGRTAAWEKIAADEEGWFKHPTMTRGGTYLFTTVKSDRDEMRLLDTAGHAMIYVNGEPRAGDVYTKGRTLLPVFLHKGENEILIVAVNRRGQTRASLLPPKAAAVFNTRDTTLPDLVVGEKVDCWASIVVLNARNEWVDDLILTATGPGGIRSETNLPVLIPQGMRKVGFKLTGPIVKDGESVEIKLELKRLTGKEGAPDVELLDEATIKLDIKQPSDVQKRTFVSRIDGSVQYFALLRATPSEEGKEAAKRPGMIFTMHGAAVEARGHCNAYRDGFPWAHVVAPTNRRPFGFDWESFGRLDAMEVFDIATDLLKPDPQRIYLSGHSMGGHGTWHIGVTYPDRFAAIGPSAGWISLFSMDELREAFEKPGTPEFTPMHELLARPRLGSDTLALSRNFKHYGIFILHGTMDDNVPVTEARRMKEHLTPFHKDLAYHEQPDAKHWWGKLCVTWPAMMTFFQDHTKPLSKDVKTVEFITANPAVSATSNWVTIEQQNKQSALSSVTITADPTKHAFDGMTDNVARLTLDMAPLATADGAAAKRVSVTLDSQTLELPWPKDDKLHLKREEKQQWVAAVPVNAKEKNPARQGPFLHAFNHRFLFVVGTRGTPEENAASLAKARFDAERFWYQGNGSVDIIRDKDFDPAAEPDRSVILFGNADTIAAWPLLLKDCPVQVKAGEITLHGADGKTQTIKGENLACLVTYPRPGSDTALVAALAGTGPIGSRLTHRLTSFSSRAGYPDWMIVGDDMLIKGTESVRAAGFFDNHWQLGETVMP